MFVVVMALSVFVVEVPSSLIQVLLLFSSSDVVVVFFLLLVVAASLVRGGGGSLLWWWPPPCFVVAPSSSVVAPSLFVVVASTQATSKVKPSQAKTNQATMTMHELHNQAIIGHRTAHYMILRFEPLLLLLLLLNCHSCDHSGNISTVYLDAQSAYLMIQTHLAVTLRIGLCASTTIL